MANYHPNVKLKSVSGIETILDFNIENNYWKSFSKLIEMDKEQSDSGMCDLAVRKFYAFIGRYIDNIGLSLNKKDFAPEKNHISLDILNCFPRTSPVKVKLKCQPIPIEGKYELVYTPHLEFEVTPETLRVRGHLSPASFNGYVAYVLSDCLKFSANGDGIRKPRIFVDKGSIKVVSIEQIKAVCDKLKELHQRIGEPRLEELADLESARRELKDCNPLAKQVLEAEYQRRKDLLLPEKLF